MNIKDELLFRVYVEYKGFKYCSHRLIFVSDTPMYNDINSFMG